MDLDIEKLQNDMALVDLLTRPKRGGSLTEILLKNLQPLQMRMEQDKNHKMPHLHVSYGRNNHAASYSIENGQRIVGQLDNKYDKVVNNWIFSNQKQLMQIWGEIQNGDDKAYKLSIGEL
ncbi:MAG: DUF4160 domain-containing protein [Bacteroidales bacterium]|nr:DUF4160 domain-containing protein [Bacteroidales bacterium]MBN2749431.1 DUF4160 domain-containing protein [Bacteroidales bacterium]